MKLLTALAVAAALTLGHSTLSAQAPSAADTSLLSHMHLGAAHFRQVVTVSAERMTAEDYAFRPTPEVRTFAQLVGHIADSNYLFCAVMKGDSRPEQSIEKTKSTKAELQQALEDSFKYCEPALLAMNGPRGRDIVKFQSRSFPALVVMDFRNYHGFLHYGNVITYMRLRGKVPPSTEP